jgi:hypothetical protein
MKSKRFDRSLLRTRSISGRCSRISPAMLWRRWDGTSAESFEASMPDVLASRSLRELARAVLRAREDGSERILMYGGHVIKCGLGPLLCSWLDRGFVTALATNGSGSIHDLEMALFGGTSEDVEAGLSDGSFGMWEETAGVYGEAVGKADSEGTGLGEALGRILCDRGCDTSSSPMAASSAAGLPVTVHPALGTDIVHPLVQVDWGKLAEAAERDFDILGERICRLGGGVVLNVGSAVVMPEVFLKLLASARNLGCPVEGFTAASFDMIRQYRPLSNVVGRPSTALGGTPVSITGHHEILLPLLDLVLSVTEKRGDWK